MANSPYVLWLATWYPHQDRPLLANFVRLHAQAARQHVRVVVLTVQPTDDPSPLSLDWVVDGGGDALIARFSRQTPWPGWLGRLHRAWRWMAAFVQAATLVRQRFGKPALLHLHVLYPLGLLAVGLAWRWRVPLLGLEHNSQYVLGRTAKLGFGHRWGIRWIASRLVELAGVSQAAVAGMQALGLRPKRWAVVPNVVDLAAFHPPEHPVPPAPFRWLHVSFLDAKKNILPQVEAFAAFQAQVPASEFWIMGAGADGPAAQARVAQLGLQDRVRFWGAVTPQQIATAMRQVHVFVFPSTVESFGVVAIEAMASGLPVVATATGILPDIVDAQTGVLVAAPTPDAIAQGVMQVYRNAAYYDTRVLQDRVRQFDLPEVGQTFRALYQRHGI